MVLTLREANLIVEEALAAARQSHSKVGVAMVLSRGKKIAIKDMRAKTQETVLLTSCLDLAQPRIASNRSSEIASSKEMPTK
jgi:hypothetical protein